MKEILGNYQNDIADLPTLDIKRYERIFKLFDVTKDGKNFKVFNILKRVELPDNISNDLIEIYDVQSRLPLTTISYNIYGDIESWWIIYLLNKDTIPSLFWADPGTQLKYIKKSLRVLIYNEITQLTNFDGQHF